MRRAERGGCAGSRRRALAAARQAWTATRTAGLAAVLALLVIAGPLAAQTAQQVQEAADKAIRRLDLQTEFPRGPEPSNLHFNFKLPPEVLWIVIAVAVGILLYALRDTLLIKQGTDWATDEGEIGATHANSEAMVVEAADELAAAGRFVEAMHVLLLQGLAYMRRRLDQQFSDSLTSREILRSTQLSAAARASLRDVVTRVELTYFGTHQAVLADYTACRESFHALTRALHEDAAA
jgi:hypothetical protein